MDAPNGAVVASGIGVVDVPGITAPSAAPIGGDSFKGPRDESLLRDAHTKIEHFLASFEKQCQDAAVSCTVFETEGLPFRVVYEQAPHARSSRRRARREFSFRDGGT